MKRKYIEFAAILAFGLSLFLFFAEVEAFELFFEFTREHEDYELDEIFSFLVAGAVILPMLLYSSRRDLDRTLTQMRLTEEKATKAARHDALTGLYNRRFLLEALEERIAKADPESGVPALLLLDLDRFKPINDLRGHEAGDFILQQVAQRMRYACYPGQMAVRLGGDEFAVLIDETEAAEHGPSLARRIATAIEAPFEAPSFTASISCSIGVAVWRPGVTAAEMIKYADQAMYKAKSDGRAGFAFYNKELGEALRVQAELESDLRAAVDSDEIQPYFQPILEIGTGKLVGFEVLARWHSPKNGLVMPDVFIPIAEETGLIGPLSWTLFRAACREAAGWPDEVSISFNISPRQFRDPQVVDHVDRLLRECRLSPKRLVIEVTESAVIEDLDDARRILVGLHRLGVRISLDDFGTGFSSLATLNELPFDNLKIDRSFVGGVLGSPQSARIVEGILALANSLGLSVTAEGIESRDELEFLGGRDCQLGQGFLFAKPMDREDVGRLLRENRDLRFIDPPGSDQSASA